MTQAALDSTVAKRSMPVGLTGGIASGKSTVADMFADLGVTIIDTDVIARDLVQPGQPALKEIADAFGSEVIDPGGHLDRPLLRSIVFANETKRRVLERILHPRIREEAAQQSRDAAPPYHLVVVPLLAESPMKKDMARIIVVDCDRSTQLARLLARDTETEEQAKRIIDAQATRTERLAIADDVISNAGDLEETRAQVQALHNDYLSLFGDGQSVDA